MVQEMLSQICSRGSVVRASRFLSERLLVLIQTARFALVARARQLFLNLRKPNHLFPVATVVCLREANTAFLQCTKSGTLV